MIRFVILALNVLLASVAHAQMANPLTPGMPCYLCIESAPVQTYQWQPDPEPLWKQYVEPIDEPPPPIPDYAYQGLSVAPRPVPDTGGGFWPSTPETRHLERMEALRSLERTIQYGQFQNFYQNSRPVACGTAFDRRAREGC